MGGPGGVSPTASEVVALLLLPLPSSRPPGGSFTCRFFSKRCRICTATLGLEAMAAQSSLACLGNQQHERERCKWGGVSEGEIEPAGAYLLRGME